MYRYILSVSQEVLTEGELTPRALVLEYFVHLLSRRRVGVMGHVAHAGRITEVETPPLTEDEVWQLMVEAKAELERRRREGGW
jgi:hypothetical protein